MMSDEDFVRSKLYRQRYQRRIYSRDFLSIIIIDNKIMLSRLLPGGTDSQARVKNTEPTTAITPVNPKFECKNVSKQILKYKKFIFLLRKIQRKFDETYENYDVQLYHR